MTPAILALLALLLAIALSMTAHVNVGLLSIALAWIIGVYAAGMRVEAVMADFPSNLFLTLAGVTFLFAVSKANGTLDLLARRAARWVGGNAALLPLVFFIFAFALSTVGPGAIASVALVAPIAMPTGRRAGVPDLLSAVMVGTGANAGNLSPISSIGAMANQLMAGVGLPNHEGKLWFTGFAVHVIVAAGAYLLFGGTRLLREARRETAESRDAAAAEPQPAMERRHRLTIGVTVAWMLAVIVFRTNVGLSAFAAGTLLIVLQVAREREVISAIPLDIILMVSGVTMLVGVLEATGGMDLFTGLIARLATPATINAVIAFVTGLISTYSSTSGVVLPAFLPMVPGLVRQVGGGDPLAVALSINVGSALVDVSPLSTLGALCVAAVPDQIAARDLFRKLLIWGLSMAVVGAVLCGLLAGPIARA